MDTRQPSESATNSRLRETDTVSSLGEVKQWRQQIHSQPELGFKEFNTSLFIVDKLKSFGVEVHQGLGGTGVVGILKNS